MKTSFFKDYYKNRLKSLREFFIASILLNLIAGPVQMISIAINSRLVPDDYSIDFIILGTISTLFFTMPAVTFVALVMPAMSRKHLLKKNYADTFNALPVTYKERYWGDLLAELTAFITPMLATAVITIICASIVSCRGGTDGQIEYRYFLLTTVYYEISFIISCIAAIALTGFMTYCFGNAHSAILYSIIGGAAMPTMLLSFIKAFSGCAVGVNGNIASTRYLSALPPFGTFFESFLSLEFFGTGDYEGLLTNFFSLNSIITTLVSLAVTAGFIIGGYYIGKKRKAEFSGNSIIFKISSTIISVIITLAVLSAGITEIENVGVFGIILMSLVMFFAFEVLNKRKTIKIFRSCLTYVIVCCAAFGMYGIANATNCFGIEDYVPEAESVEKISIHTEHKNGISAAYYNDMVAISTITEMHSELLKNKENLSSGGTLVLSYTLKNGAVIGRNYHLNDQKLIDELFLMLVKLPQSEDNKYSILTNENLDLEFSVMLDEDTTKAVKEEKSSELKKILLDDIIADFSNQSEAADADSVIELNATYLDDGTPATRIYTISPKYPNTFAFLTNPDNLTDYTPEVNFTDENIRIQYRFDGGDVYVSFDAENPIPDELRSMITNNKQDSSEFFVVMLNEYANDIAYISKADEARAREIFFNEFSEALTTTAN